MISPKTDILAEYADRLAHEKEKSSKKHGDAFEKAVGNLQYDAQDYAINELVGLVRYGEIIAARATLYGEPSGINLGEEIQSVANDLALRLIKHRNKLIERGINLGQPEHAKQKPE